jgi:hypothetical protein
VYRIDDLDKRGLNGKITKIKRPKKKIKKGLECNLDTLDLGKKLTIKLE